MVSKEILRRVEKKEQEDYERQRCYRQSICPDCGKDMAQLSYEKCRPSTRFFRVCDNKKCKSYGVGV